MGNKPTRNKMQQPYQQMVEDAIAALKERPGTTQSDVFNYLETKYEGRISPRIKKNLQTVIRSVIKTKKGLKRRGRRPPRGIGRKARIKAKGGLGRKSGRLRRGLKIRKMTRRSKDLKKKTLKTLKSGKKPIMPGPKQGGHRLLRRVCRGMSRDYKLLLRPMSRKSSIGSLGLPRRINERSKKNCML